MAGAEVRVIMHSDASIEAIRVAEPWLQRAAIQVTSEAKRLCPVDTGYLRSSIHMEERSDGIYVGSDVEYAAVIEYGWSQKAPNGYLRPALDSVMSKLGSL